ncbi:MAG: hypothetical protein ACKO8I_08360 [Cyanobacteriota bacterium]
MTASATPPATPAAAAAEKAFEAPARGDFPPTAPAANPVYYRTYSRRQEAGRRLPDCCV